MKCLNIMKNARSGEEMERVGWSVRLKLKYIHFTLTLKSKGIKPERLEVKNAPPLPKKIA